MFSVNGVKIIVSVKGFAMFFAVFFINYQPSFCS
jgi:hypothetical protein